MDSKVIIQSTRIPFLVITPASVFLGASTVVVNELSINLYFLGLALIGALFAHVSVNALKEYFDFKSGLDLMTKKTPFSGGSGSLPDKPEMLNTVLAVALVSLLITLVIGIFFVWQYGVGIVPLGLIGISLIVFYSGWINKYPYLCLIAPGVGFGFLMVVGTQYVLVGQYMTLSWMVALIPFFMVNNLLLLNQYPDIQADSKVGRNHFPIAFGLKRSNLIYGLFILLTIAAIIGHILSGYFPVLSLIAILPVPLALYSLSGAINHGENIGAYPQYLAANVATVILMPLLLGVSLIYG